VVRHHLSVLILVANLFFRQLKPRDVGLFCVLLLTSLLFTYVVPVSGILGQHFVLRGPLSGVVMALPLLFAGIIFATSLRGPATVEIAFGSNLLGAVVGGMLEYSSLMFGIRALYLIAALAYVLSWLGLRQKTP
jgi:hypothetical protein